MEALAKNRESNTPWIFGDSGRPFLGLKSQELLLDIVGATSSRDVLTVIRSLDKKTVRNGADLSRVTLDDVVRALASIFDDESFKRRSNLLQAGFFVEHLPADLCINDLNLSIETVQVLERAGLEPKASAQKIGALTWSEVLDAEGGWFQIFEIANSSCDWTPWLIENDLTIRGSESLDVVVNKILRQAGARIGLDNENAIRWAEAIKVRNGWGIERESLAKVADRFRISSERVRQIQYRIEFKMQNPLLTLPSLLAELLEHNVNIPSADLCESLRSEGFSISPSWDWPTLQGLYNLLGYGHLASNWLELNKISDEDIELQKSLDKAIRASKSDVGIIKLDAVKNLSTGTNYDLEEVRSRIPAIYSHNHIVENYASVSRIGKNSIQAETAKQLAVSSPLSVEAIHQGLTQFATYRTSQRTFPPVRVLRLLLVSLGFQVDENDQVTGDGKHLDEEHIGNWLLNFIRDSQGAVSTRAAVLRAGIPLGASLSTLTTYLSYCSWIRFLGDGVYTLVGVEPRAVDIDFAKRVDEAQSINNSPAIFRVSDGGKLIEGNIVFSTPFLSNGLLAIGPQLSALLGKTKLKILCCAAIEMNGLASVKQGSLYGLSTLRQHLIRSHGIAEGATFQFQVAEGAFQVIF